MIVVVVNGKWQIEFPFMLGNWFVPSEEEELSNDMFVSRVLPLGGTTIRNEIKLWFKAPSQGEDLSLSLTTG